MTESARPEESRQRLVVVGSGMATTRLVEELVARRAAERYDVTVLGDEPVAPYNRILLSAVLEGTHRPEALTLRSPEWYAEHGVDLRLGARVLGVDRDHRDVMLVDGTLIEYDVLVLATGSIPTLPPIRGLVRMDGSLHDAVHAFRSLADCERLLAAIEETDHEGRPVNRRAVVVGGGLLGLQVARALGTRGLDTEIVEGAEHLLHQQIDTAAGRILARDLKKLGVAVYTGSRAVRLDAEDGAFGRGSVRVLDPLPRYLRPDYVVNDQLVVDGGVIAGEDPRVPDVLAALALPDAGDRAVALADLGIGAVARDRTVPTTPTYDAR